jgi:hypothetical protein
MEKLINGAPITRYKNTIFVALPPSAWRIIDGGCSCRYCSDTDLVPGPAYWDTLVISAKPAKKNARDYATTCHYPELQGAKPLRD